MLRQDDGRNFPAIIGFATMGGAPEREKAVFGRIGALSKRYNRFQPRRRQRRRGEAGKIELEMAGI